MIFFDLDATLLDHDEAQKQGSFAFQKEYAEHFPETPDEFFQRFYDCAEKHMDRYFRNETSHQGQRRARMRELFDPLEISDEEADTRFQCYLDNYKASWNLYPDALPCLEALKEIPLGIITNGSGEQQRNKLNGMQLTPYFKVITVSGELGFAKPDPRIFEAAASGAGVPSAECVYIGDRFQTDALAAAQSGFTGIWLDRKGEADGSEEIAVIQTLDALPGLLI